MGFNRLGLAVAAQHVHQLMLDHVLDGHAGGLEVLAGIEVIRMLREVLDGCRPVMARRRSESMLILHTAMVAALRSMLLRDTHGVGHLAAVLVDHLHDIPGMNGGSAVQHDGEARQTLGNLFQNVETEGRGNQQALLVAGARAAVNL